MTPEQYADYEKRFGEVMADYDGFSSGSWMQVCSECPSDADYDDGICYEAESYFSWHRCDICDSSLGGSRSDSHAFYNGALIHLRVCSDCVYYAEYGQLDDQTMLELEASL